MGEILTLQELLSLPVEQAKEVMLELSRANSDQKLAATWSTHFTLVRKLRSILGIHKNHSGTIVNVTEILGDKWPPSFRLTTRRHQSRASEKVVVMQAVGEEQIFAPAAVRGLALSIRGIYSGTELEPRIEAIRALLSGSGNTRYTIDLSLDEVIASRPAAAKIDQETASVAHPAPRRAQEGALPAAAGEECFYEQQAIR